MKNSKSRRLVLIALSVCLLMTMIAVGFALHAVALEGDPTLRVKSFALTLENNVCMDFKVSHTNVSDASDIQLLVWTDVPAEYKKGTEDYALTSKGAEGANVETFQYENFAAKQMTEMIYVCAYVEQNGTETYSSPAKFSIAMYAYLKRNASNPDAELVALLDSMLEYGAMSQKYFKYNLDFLATDELCQVTVVNGTLSDGFAKGWYKKGTTTLLTASETMDGKDFLYWENSAGAQVSADLSYSVTVSKTAETYTAVYGEVQAPVASEGLKYTLNSDGASFSVSGIGTCTDLDIVIPSTYQGLPVTSIGVNAFGRCSSLTSVTIPNSVTSIGDIVFNGCSSLMSITIPGSVTSIGWLAFQGCSSLENIVVDESNMKYHSAGNCLIETESKKVIAGCKNSIIPTDGSVTSIGNDAFYGCSSLTSFTIPDSVTSIGVSAFDGCSSLTSVTISNSVTSISDDAFYGCSSLTSVYYGGTAEDWAKISISSYGNTKLTNAPRYYYSETEPTDTTYQYWHYVDGVPTKW